MSAYLYNPDDEPISQAFNGHEYTLAPNGVTEVKSLWKDITDDHVVSHLVEHLGRWGVVRVSGPKLTAQDKATIAAAQGTYLKSTMEWAETQIREWSHQMAPRREAGLSEKPPPMGVVKARKWLKDNEAALRTAKLIA